MAVSEKRLGTRASDAVSGGEVLAPLDPVKITEAVVRAFARPRVLGREGVRLAREGVRIAAGRSDVTPPRGDWRFSDPTWSEHPLYRRLGQAYLAWSDAVARIVDEDGLDWRTAERARFATRILTTAAAPTNQLAGNPAALKRAFETSGRSLVRGARNFATEMARNGGLPAQVDVRPFRVGETVAATPGAVVLRDEMFELIQYTPTTKNVYARPVLMIPPQINKYYFMDLAPGRSFTEYAVSQGVQFFTMSWRNPGPEHRDWGLQEYIEACLRAVDAVCAIAGSEDFNLLGLCAGGISASVMLGHMAAQRDRRCASATFAVTILDFAVPSSIGMFGDEKIAERAKRQSAKKGFLDGRQLGKIFTLLRPNDLVWNYWVNNYLMGKDPPAFDILAWNSDGTRLPAALHADFLDIFVGNSLTEPGGVEVLGTPVNLAKVTCDTYVVGGKTDHLTPWEACYRTTQLLGGESEFVLTGTGHIQSLVSPPGVAKSRLWVGPRPHPDPHEWLAKAEERQGVTWWDHWADWIHARSGDQRPASGKLGNDDFGVVEPAPGRYVLEK